MKINMKWLTAISIVLVLAGCQGKPNEESAPAIEVDLAPAPQEAAAEGVVPPAPEPVQRKLVKNGRIEFETADAEATRKTILSAVKAVNGYVGEDNEERSSGTISYTMEVRVPTGRFETFLASATKDVTDFRHKSISNEDVTANYVDTESRIKTKKDIENRYRALLGKATTVEEILQIESQLGEIRTDIEAMEAQFKQLNNNVEYATLDIVFFKSLNTSNPFIGEIREAFGEGANSFGTFIVMLVAIWPFVLLAAGLIVAVNSWKRRKRKASTSPAAEIPSEQQ
jgi:DNA-binding FrmR family transcriptional regulator